jgi:hypothetical protein
MPEKPWVGRILSVPFAAHVEQIAGICRSWGGFVFWCGNGGSRSDNFTLPRNTARPRLEAQPNGLPTFGSAGRQSRNSVRTPEYSPCRIGNRLVPSSAVGMETRRGSHRDPSSRRHLQSLQRRMVSRGIRTRHRRGIVALSCLTPNQSRIYR